jgi:hypothetical protein
VRTRRLVPAVPVSVILSAAKDLAPATDSSHRFVKFLAGLLPTRLPSGMTKAAAEAGLRHFKSYFFFRLSIVGSL